MIEIKKVRGSQETVPALEVNIDTVYVRTGIIAISEECFNGWEYDEIQYSIQEWIQLMSGEQQALSDAVADIIMGGM